MVALSPNRQTPAGSAPYLLPRLPILALALAMVVTPALPARAQISLTTAVDLALHSNPRVQGAQADVTKARAQVSEMHDVFVPAITAGAGLGQAYGYLPSPPTLFTVNAGSVVFSASQGFYIRSARAGLNAAQLALEDVRETVALDTALAFIAVGHDQQREQVVRQEAGFADALVTIVQERADAGQDTQIGLTQARLTAAQLRLSTLHAEDDTANDREHLARLMGIPPDALRVDDNFPETPVPLDEPSAPTQGYANPAVASAYANAEAKQQQAKGDARFRFWPQITSVIQYNRYATFTNSFKDLENIYKGNNGLSLLTSNEAAFGVLIQLPFFDAARSARARETAADAAKALHDAQNAQIDALDGQTRARHTIAELKDQADVAAFEQQLAQQQLDVLLVQLQNGTGDANSAPMTPKDEQKARINEREKYLGVIDAGFQWRQAEIQLLRQTGKLLDWLNSTAATQPATGTSLQNGLPSSPSPQH
jgi:outer membrane protein TolC